MIYYKLRNGNIVDEYSLYKAFEIATGEEFHYSSIEYSRWLYSLLGSSIVKAMKETEIDIMQFINGNYIIGAIRRYREIHGCGLHEAKEAIDKMREV